MSALTGARNIEYVANLLAAVVGRTALPWDAQVGLALILTIVDVNRHSRDIVGTLGRDDVAPSLAVAILDLVRPSRRSRRIVHSGPPGDFVLLWTSNGVGGWVREASGNPANGAGRFPNLRH